MQLSVGVADLHNILCELKGIVSEWFDLGLALKNLEYYEIKAIEEKHHGDPENCLRELIVKWLEAAESSERSWKTLHSALLYECVKRHDLARRIKEKYID